MPGEELSVGKRMSRDIVNETLGKAIAGRAEHDRAIADSMKRIADLQKDHAELLKEVESEP